MEPMQVAPGVREEIKRFAERRGVYGSGRLVAREGDPEREQPSNSLTVSRNLAHHS